MSRQIYLPELLSINIKNYTLYPNGLDYNFDFVKGVNLILGGNGMGKTTFVNIIRFGLIGLYKKQRDYTRTYKDKAIIKRQLYPSDFFSARKDERIIINDEAMVNMSFKFNDARFEVRRSLESGDLLAVFVNGDTLAGKIISEDKYEKLSIEAKTEYLLHSYELAVLQFSNLSFDDLIFFVNEILFFGESHKTVLWNDGFEGRYDVQNELFNKYFNEPKLDIERQEAQRQARYFDSLSRHKSEDMRVITNLLNKLSKYKENIDINKENRNEEDIIKLNNKLLEMKSLLERIHGSRNIISQDISQLQGEINSTSLKAAEVDKEKNQVEKDLNTKLWEQLNPQYDVYMKNIQLNHLCPMCNQPEEELVKKIEQEPTRCFVCSNEIHLIEDKELTLRYKEILSIQKGLYQSIANKQRKIKALETEIEELDQEFKNIDIRRRAIQQQIRELEYKSVTNGQPVKLQALYDEYERYSKEKEEYQKESAKYQALEQSLTKQIENEILKNVSRFSSIFASYAENFLGVSCSLAYEKYDSTMRRFYPVIDGKLRRHEEALSESQRFFIDHSFRMSILTFFYQTPSFYIVETPDSSLDISYERNAANVFLRFLKNPNSIIITSNLNNSSFVSHLIENHEIFFSMVGLFDIAKKSAIQGTSDQLKSIYTNIKERVQL